MVEQNQRQDSSPIKNVDLQDSMDVSLVNAMNEEEKAKALKEERQKSIELIAKLKEAIQKFEGETDLVKEDIQEQLDRNKSIEEENKQQLLHLETVNMMTKYQIVYTKLETTLYNIVRTTEAKQQQRKRRALQKLARNVTQINIRKENRKKLVCVHLENRLSSFTLVMTRYLLFKEVHGMFSRWKVNALTQARGSALQKKNTQQMDQMEKELGINRAILTQYDEKLKAQKHENQTTSQQIKERQNHLTDLDTKCQELKQQSTPNTASNRAGQGGQDTKQKIKRLQEKILAL